MKNKNKKHFIHDDLRLSPEERLCAKYDRHSILDELTAQREGMGVAVIDNCAEEHIQ